MSFLGCGFPRLLPLLDVVVSELAVTFEPLLLLDASRDRDGRRLRGVLDMVLPFDDGPLMDDLRRLALRAAAVRLEADGLRDIIRASNMCAMMHALDLMFVCRVRTSSFLFVCQLATVRKARMMVRGGGGFGTKRH